MQQESAKTTDKIRVCQIVGKMNGGGVESFLLEYYRHINREKIQFDFIVDSDSTLIPYSEIEALGGKILLVPPYQQPLAYWKALQEILRNGNYRIVHSHINALSPIPLSAAYWNDVPVRIAHSHATAGKGEPLRNTAKRFLKLFANMFPTHRTACSEYAGKWLFGSNRNTMIIENAVDLDSLVFNSAERDKFRMAYNIPKNAFVMGHMGRMVETKNQQFLLDCLKLALERRPDTLLLLAGKGPLEEQYKHYARQIDVFDNVRFLGYLNNRSSFYNAIDAFVFPSLYEGFGTALLEAQQCQLPCICSNRIQDEVIHSQKVERLPLSAPTDQWVQKILAPSPPRTDGVAGLDAAALQRFDINKAAIKLEHYYEKLYDGTMQ